MWRGTGVSDANEAEAVSFEFGASLVMREDLDYLWRGTGHLLSVYIWACKSLGWSQTWKGSFALIGFILNLARFRLMGSLSLGSLGFVLFVIVVG